MRSVWFCLGLVLLLAAHDAEAQAQTKRVKHAKPAAAAKQAAPVVDTRPRLRRDDTPAPVVAAPAAQPVAKQKRRARHRPAGTPAAPAAAGAATKPAKGAKATARDVVACAQDRVADLALEGCTRIIEDAKQKPKARGIAFYNRGNAYVLKGDHDKAIADFDQALKLEPKNASIYNNRGNARLDKGESDAAMADFEAAIKTDPRYAAAYFNRANALAAKGEIERALKDYDAAIKHNKRNVNAYIARGALLLASGASAKARADMKQAARLAPKNAYAVLWFDIAERRAKQKGRLAARNGMKGLDLKAWPAPVVRLYAGEIKPDAVRAGADSPSDTVKAAQVCEANFYSGEYALIGGAREDATRLFQAAVKDCPRGFLEGIAAAAELKGMGEKVGAN
jgi:lipoprotein NlpI